MSEERPGMPEDVSDIYRALERDMQEMQRDDQPYYDSQVQSQPDLQVINDDRCFGRGTAVYADELKDIISGEIKDSIYYRTLARRSPNQRLRQTFIRLSNEERRHARRFAAAYYLSTGTSFFPRGLTVNVPAYKLALRERFIEENRAAVKYARIGNSTQDPCFKELMLDTAEDERQHAQIIRSVLEEMNG